MDWRVVGRVHRVSPLVAATLVFGAVVSSCTVDPTLDTNKSLVKLYVNTSIGSDATLEAGESEQFVAWASYADDTVREVSSDSATKWQSSNPRAAVVGETGLVTAISEGSAVIRASYKGQSAARSIKIVPCNCIVPVITTTGARAR